MIKKLFLFFFQLSITCSLFSQEIKKGDVYAYARKVVDTLASPAMHGRGYVNGGDSIAADYIKAEFKKYGLKNFRQNYYQRLSFAVNTFPSGPVFKWGKIGELRIGKDYIIVPSSAAAPVYASGSRVEWLDSATFYNPGKLKKFLKKKLGSSFIAVNINNKGDEEMIRFFEQQDLAFRGLIFIKHHKLTADFSQRTDKFPSVELLLHDNLTIDNLKAAPEVEISFSNRFLPYHVSQNVIGYVEGSEQPDSFIVFSAHYDHIGEMGGALFPGANDNASGCAMLLSLAKYYSMPEHKPKCSIAFMAFCGEEVGLLGSRYYTEHPLFPLKNIKFLLNMDIMGTGEDGITVVNGSVFKPQFDKLKQINADHDFIRDVKIRGKAANSDHYFFSEKGVNAFFIYTMGGIKAYHDIYDRPETLPLNEFEDLFKLITTFGDYLQH